MYVQVTRLLSIGHLSVVVVKHTVKTHIHTHYAKVHAKIHTHTDTCSELT